MFSFHKPRVYRSTEGCCICRAKSSSSRFTDSRKYEIDSMKCFDLKNPRHGEICNACVLLVKRYKRLPQGSNRHWGHMVDARAGPGTKSLTKYRRYSTCSASREEHSAQLGLSTPTFVPPQLPAPRQLNTQPKLIIPTTTNTNIQNKYIPNKIFQKNNLPIKRGDKTELTTTLKRKPMAATTDSLPSSTMSFDFLAPFNQNNKPKSNKSIEKTNSNNNYKNNNTNINNTNNNNVKKSSHQQHHFSINGGASKRRKLSKPNRLQFSIINNKESQLPFFDMESWEERKLCCGQAFESKYLPGAVVIDLSKYQPCAQHKQTIQNDKEQNKITEKLNNKKQNAITTQAVIIPTSTSISTPIPIQTPVSTPAIISTAISTPIVTVVTTPVIATSISTTTTTTSTSISTSTSTSITATAIASSLAMPAPAKPKTNITTNSTPVLKKHHLFFKRQSECFPHADLNNSSQANKTEMSNSLTITMPTNLNNNNININNNNINNNNNNNNINNNSSAAAIANMLKPITASNHIQLSPIMSGNYNITSQTNVLNMPVSNTLTYATITPHVTTQNVRHSTAKLSPALPPPVYLTAPVNTSRSGSVNTTNNSFVQKTHIKPTTTDVTSKVLKHSLEKLNTNLAPRNKGNDLTDLKNVVKNMEHKSYVLAAPTKMNNTGNINSLITATNNNNNTTHFYHHPPLTVATLTSSNTTVNTASTSAGSSPSSSSSSSTKFSDNSSDSGFDENVLDRKSASPLVSYLLII